MNEITLDEYQEFVESTWIPEETPLGEELRIFYGIVGELGELSELNKKFMRDGGDPEEWRENFKKEFGDIFYYLAKFANYFDIDLTEVLQLNVLKLTSRKERNVIKGSGDNR